MLSDLQFFGDGRARLYMSTLRLSLMNIGCTLGPDFIIKKSFFSAWAWLRALCMILGITCRSYTGVTPQFRFPGRHCNLTLSELAALRKKTVGHVQTVSVQ